ncbi:MAG: hypothetical protein BMS9Abin36_1444 [Gammaproteobacteria bacterium]|nr:MAG: hypothetical protein BMS9Abin36_1444 [Gammaproteobacteria bacterium]
MLYKTIIIIFLFLIIGSLLSGLLFMFKDQGKDSDRMVKALSLRVGLSVTLFLILMAGFYFGIMPSRY